jgi:hypothetical protein
MVAETTDNMAAPGTDLAPIAAARPPATAKTQVRRAPVVATATATEEDHVHGFPVDRLLHA